MREFNLDTCIVYHILVFTGGTEWSVGFKTQSSDVTQLASDPVLLDQAIAAFRDAGATLVGWDQRDVLERVLGRPLDCDHVDLKHRAKQAGEYPNLETIGTNLTVKQIPELLLLYPSHPQMDLQSWQHIT